MDRKGLIYMVLGGDSFLEGGFLSFDAPDPHMPLAAKINAEVARLETFVHAHETSQTDQDRRVLQRLFTDEGLLDLLIEFRDLTKRYADYWAKHDLQVVAA